MPLLKLSLSQFDRKMDALSKAEVKWLADLELPGKEMYKLFAKNKLIDNSDSESDDGEPMEEGTF